jgi:hypothetical protein
VAEDADQNFFFRAATNSEGQQQRCQQQKAMPAHQSDNCSPETGLQEPAGIKVGSRLP